MTRFPRHFFPFGLSFALALFFSAVLSSAATAGQIAYVRGVVRGPCGDGSAVCARGIVSAVDTTTNQVLGTLDLGASSSETDPLLVNPSGSRLYAVLHCCGASIPGTLPVVFTIIKVFDTRTMAKLSEFSIGGDVTNCVFSPDGARLVCARGFGFSNVVVIDAATESEVATTPATSPERSPYDVTWSPSGDRLYVAHEDNQITVHHGSSYAVLATVPLAARPLKIAVTPDGRHLYAALADRSVADIDTTTDTLAGIVPDVTTAPVGLADVTFARGKAYVIAGGFTGTQNEVAVIEVATRAVVAHISVGRPLGIATSLDEARVFVSGEVGLSAIDTATDQVVAVTSLPDGPGRLALGPPAPYAGLVVDLPGAGARLAQPFTVGGWAVDVSGFSGGPGIDAVHVWAFPANGNSPIFLGAADSGRPRSDIAALFGPAYLPAGYQLTVRGLAPGAYTLTVYGHSSRTGTFSLARQVVVRVTSSLQMAVDTPTAGASVPGMFSVAGWALDGASASGAGVDAVHVWAYPTSGAAPIFAGAATLGGSRPDVAAAFGTAFGTAGYSLTVSGLPAGAYTLRIYAHQASSSTFAAERAVPIVVTAPQPYLFIDTPAAGATVGPGVRAAGWAIENGAASGTGVDAVHVWAYPAAGGSPLLIGVAAYGSARPDVGAIFGSRYAPS
ncbi:MAG: YncE family protein, partial [Acidobacteriota bacterium]